MARNIGIGCSLGCCLEIRHEIVQGGFQPFQGVLVGNQKQEAADVLVLKVEDGFHQDRNFPGPGKMFGDSLFGKVTDNHMGI